jgi:hypothetical protein
MHPHVLSGYVLLLEGSAGGGELLTLCIRARVIGCGIPCEWFACQFLEVAELRSFEPVMASGKEDGFGCPYGRVWFRVYFVKNKPWFPFGRKPLDDTNRVCQSPLVPIRRCNGSFGGILALC